ncbi:hypothetical protein vseg_004712 [Gypsophila vaccaria]
MGEVIRSDSVRCRQIVQAFLDFLHSSVEVGPGGVDVVEPLEVASDCLSQAFQLHLLPPPHRPSPHLLLRLFSSSRPASDTSPSPSPSDAAADHDHLFALFFDALEKSRFFPDDPSLLDRATCLFHSAVNEIETSGGNVFDPTTLADALKVLGNKAMQSLSYSDAIERYTCAIALCSNNAVYYCNRAAAYTQMHKYNEAIQDCLKSIEIDPNYSKGYSRMGLVYYAQGKYSDAINKGFRKALELDPNNDAVKENIRVAEQKLMEEQEQRNRSQNYGYHPGGGSAEQAAQSPFGSIPGNVASMFSNLAGSASLNQNGHSVDTNHIPVQIASMVENIARTFGGRDPEGSSSDQTRESEASRPSASGSASAFASFEAGTVPPNDLAGMFMNMTGQTSEQGSNVGGSDDAGIPRGGNFTFNFGGQTPEELSQALSSMMGMFSGGSQGNPQGNTDGRPESR